MVINYIILPMLVFCLILLMAADFIKKDNPRCIIITFIAMLIGACVHYSVTREEPSAIDVYRHRTSLKITYKDNIPVDTIVVFK